MTFLLAVMGLLLLVFGAYLTGVCSALNEIRRKTPDLYAEWLKRRDEK